MPSAPCTPSPRLRGSRWHGGGGGPRGSRGFPAVDPGFVLASGRRAVRPPPDGAAEALPVALPVLQRPSADQSAVPVAHRRLLQQPSEQDHSGTGDELRSPGHVHPGTSRAVPAALEK